MSISAGETKSTSVGISNARAQLKLVVCIHEWAIRVIAAKRKQDYQFTRVGHVFIPRAARKKTDDQDKLPSVENGIHTYVKFV